MQTQIRRSHLIRVFTVCYSTYNFWMHNCTVKPKCIILRKSMVTICTCCLPILEFVTVVQIQGQTIPLQKISIEGTLVVLTWPTKFHRTISILGINGPYTLTVGSLHLETQDTVDLFYNISTILQIHHRPIIKG